MVDLATLLGPNPLASVLLLTTSPMQTIDVATETQWVHFEDLTDDKEVIFEKDSSGLRIMGGITGSSVLSLSRTSGMF